jgi:hypothetical protein
MAFTMTAGDTINIFTTITDKFGTAIDLSSSTSIRWWASRGNTESFSRTPVLMKSIENGAGIDEVSLLDGQFVVRIKTADTAGLNGSYYCETEIRDAAGNVSTPVIDSFTVKKDLIR